MSCASIANEASVDSASISDIKGEWTGLCSWLDLIRVFVIGSAGGTWLAKLLSRSERKLCQIWRFYEELARGDVWQTSTAAEINYGDVSVLSGRREVKDGGGFVIFGAGISVKCGFLGVLFENRIS